VLVGCLVVCWEMITGAAAAGELPHGCVPLAPLDVAANLTPGRCVCVCGRGGWSVCGEPQLAFDFASQSKLFHICVPLAPLDVAATLTPGRERMCDHSMCVSLTTACV
jgi:hypothetical protein